MTDPDAGEFTTTTGKPSPAGRSASNDAVSDEDESQRTQPLLSQPHVQMNKRRIVACRPGNRDLMLVPPVDLTVPTGEIEECVPVTETTGTPERRDWAYMLHQAPAHSAIEIASIAAAASPRERRGGEALTHGRGS
jgi:hypothetical protein